MSECKRPWKRWKKCAKTVTTLCLPSARLLSSWKLFRLEAIGRVIITNFHINLRFAKELQKTAILIIIVCVASGKRLLPVAFDTSPLSRSSHSDTMVCHRILWFTLIVNKRQNRRKFETKRVFNCHIVETRTKLNKKIVSQFRPGILNLGFLIILKVEIIWTIEYNLVAESRDMIGRCGGKLCHANHVIVR